MKSLTILLSITFQLLFAASATAQLTQVFRDSLVKSRIRVIIDNDFSGDPDGLFQLVHQVLSPSVEIRGIIGSHLKPGDGFDPSGKTATNACAAARLLLTKMNWGDSIPIYEGSNTGLSSGKLPQASAGAKAIVREAMHEDTDQPLYVICGAGLTEIASAWLMEPRIARRLTLIWIGGPEYPDLDVPPPGHTSLEYNLGIDLLAGQTIFNESDIPLWQVPRNVYRQALVSYAELLLKVKPQGAVGEWLVGKIEQLMLATQKFKLLVGEIYILGDSPLVLLTALQSSFEADPSSSDYVTKAAPKINDAGLYEANSTARNIRVYTRLDTRLMLDDLFAKLALFNVGKTSASGTLKIVPAP